MANMFYPIQTIWFLIFLKASILNLHHIFPIPNVYFRFNLLIQKCAFLCVSCMKSFAWFLGEVKFSTIKLKSNANNIISVYKAKCILIANRKCFIVLIWYIFEFFFKKNIYIFILANKQWNFSLNLSHNRQPNMIGHNDLYML